MDRRDVREVLSYEPFRPLLFHLVDGTVIEIDHPDLALLGRRTITLGLPSEDDGEHDAVVPLSSILWVEVIVRSKPKEGMTNGASS
jgi:hypothetical protein